MNEAQLAALKKLIKSLLAVVSVLEETAGKAQTDVQALRTRVAQLLQEIDTLIAACEATGDGIECDVLRAVRRVVDESARPLTAANGPAPTALQYTEMAKAVEGEAATLRMLRDAGGLAGPRPCLHQRLRCAEVDDDARLHG